MNLADTYRRIIKSAKKGQGTRLTAEECKAMWLDNAVEQCVWVDDAAKAEREEEEKGSRL